MDCLKTDYSRRQALVEIDVLVAMSLGIKLYELKERYRLQFPAHKKYEDNTWYDANGRIVFTINKGLSGVGFDRNDTMPGGPVDRTIEYVAPFDRCDREQDYETAWKFFEEKYAKKD